MHALCYSTRWTTGVISLTVFSLSPPPGTSLWTSGAGQNFPSETQKQLTGEIPAGFLRKQFANLRPPISPPVPLDVEEEAFRLVSGLFLSLLAFPCLM